MADIPSVHTRFRSLVPSPQVALHGFHDDHCDQAIVGHWGSDGQLANSMLEPEHQIPEEQLRDRDRLEPVPHVELHDDHWPQFDQLSPVVNAFVVDGQSMGSNVTAVLLQSNRYIE